MKYCSHCGSKINQDSNFCTNCGYKLKEDKNFQIDTTNKINIKKKGFNKGSIITLIFFLIIWGILNSLYPTNNILMSGIYGGVSGIIAYIIYIIFITIFDNN
jgi:uncharacterized membrane protein YvbJ